MMLCTYFKKVQITLLLERLYLQSLCTAPIHRSNCVVTTTDLYKIYRRFWKTSYKHSETQIKTAN